MLSQELLSSFAKITNDRADDTSAKEINAKVTNVTRDTNNAIIGVEVLFDGAETPVPVSTTVDVVQNERVKVEIKNHSAIITGNMSSPSARKANVEELANDINGLSDDLQDSGRAIDDARKVATNYLYYGVRDGLIISEDASKPDEGNNVQITGDGVKVRDGSTVLAEYGQNIKLYTAGRESYSTNTANSGLVNTISNISSTNRPLIVYITNNTPFLLNPDLIDSTWPSIDLEGIDDGQYNIDILDREKLYEANTDAGLLLLPNYARYTYLSNTFVAYNPTYMTWESNTKRYIIFQFREDLKKDDFALEVDVSENWPASEVPRRVRYLYSDPNNVVVYDRSGQGIVCKAKKIDIYSYIDTKITGYLRICDDKDTSLSLSKKSINSTNGLDINDISLSDTNIYGNILALKDLNVEGRITSPKSFSCKKLGSDGSVLAEVHCGVGSGTGPNETNRGIWDAKNSKWLFRAGVNDIYIQAPNGIDRPTGEIIPYYTKGDTIETQIITGGVIGGLKKLYFEVPLSKPIARTGTATIPLTATNATGGGIKIRKNNKFLGQANDSTSSFITSGFSYLAELEGNNSIRITITFNNNINNAVANDVVGVTWNGKITIG